MKTALARAVLSSIQAGGPREGLIAPGDRVAVAVSGGADSVALLRLLTELHDDLGITLLVAHFDHSLRKRSASDARFVEKLAKSQGFAFVAAREDVAAAAKEKKWNLEDAGRRLRYEFFSRLVAEGRATRVAVAHTMDDQAETVVARLLRGTGPAGLAGIYPVAGHVVRPLLDFRREELRKYLRKIGQLWREDATNSDTRRQRAAIRKRVLPLLERDFSSAIVPHLAGLARLAREDEVFWATLIEDRFRALVMLDENRSRISAATLLNPLQFPAPAPSIPSDIQRPLTERLIRRLYQEVRGSKSGLTSSHVEQVIRLADTSQSGRRVELPGRILAERSFGEIEFLHASDARGTEVAQRETSEPGSAYHHVVDLRSNAFADVRVPALGTCFRLKVIDWPAAERETNGREAFLDLERLAEPLVLRSWRAGDSYRPRGRRNRRNLKEMFVTGRVARHLRSLWPVLESRGQIVWARGMAPAEEFCAGKGTRTGVLIEECKL